ncbi:MAG: hypothetical protein HYU64_02310 [Armatimonadetes bacterium]|nr:hypothetical protein [Armatimonadota bacterium]
MQTNQILPQSAISGTSALGPGTGLPLKPGGQGGANGIQSPLLQRGQVLNGSVIGTLGDKVALRLGQTRWVADSTLPLSVGQRIQVQVDGELDGKVALRLLTLDRSLAFSKLEMGDLANHLSSLRLPQSDEHLAGARALLEFNVPLTRENLESLRNALSQLGRFSDTQLTAAAFLKGAEAPLTTQNINTLAHFLWFVQALWVVIRIVFQRF